MHHSRHYHHHTHKRGKKTVTPVYNAHGHSLLLQQHHFFFFFEHTPLHLTHPKKKEAICIISLWIVLIHENKNHHDHPLLPSLRIPVLQVHRSSYMYYVRRMQVNKWMP